MNIEKNYIKYLYQKKLKSKLICIELILNLGIPMIRQHSIMEYKLQTKSIKSKLKLTKINI